MNNVQRIEKEELGKYSFIRKEVLPNKEEIHERLRQLMWACRIGNEAKSKVKIRFETTEGIKEVYTTIWAVGMEVISLKHGAVIPIKAIRDVIV